jgi:short subunit dehydrogenase-like uncharacterized protein
MEASTRWMIYGATGYTGTLLAEEAVRRGLRPVLSGRSEEKLRPLAERLGLSHVTVGLEDPAALRGALEGIAGVLHAAGPFVDTSAPMREACLAAGAHYLDITGELPVFEATFAASDEAKRRNIAMVCGVGFDVVPTDCLGVYVAKKVQQLDTLEIAVAVPSPPSAGTAKSALSMVGYGVQVRRNGQLESLPLGQGVRRVRFSQRESWAVPVPLGDLVSLFHSTGAPNITTSFAVPEQIATVLRVPVAAATSGFLAQLLLTSDKIRGLLEKQIERHAHPSDEKDRATGKAFVWAQAIGKAGDTAEAWLELPNAYAYTANIAIRAMERTLDSGLSGALSPAQAYGVDFALEAEGSRRLDTI